MNAFWFIPTFDKKLIIVPRSSSYIKSNVNANPWSQSISNAFEVEVWLEGFVRAACDHDFLNNRRTPSKTDDEERKSRPGGAVSMGRMKGRDVLERGPRLLQQKVTHVDLAQHRRSVDVTHVLHWAKILFFWLLSVSGQLHCVATACKAWLSSAEGASSAQTCQVASWTQKHARVWGSHCCGHLSAASCCLGQISHPGSH